MKEFSEKERKKKKRELRKKRRHMSDKLKESPKVRSTQSKKENKQRTGECWERIILKHTSDIKGKKTLMCVTHERTNNNK